MKNDYDDTMKSDFQALKEDLKERHDKRVADTPRRVQFAIEQLEKNEIEYEVKNASIGHIHAWRKSDGKLFQFWAGTGKILGQENKRGIFAFIDIVRR